MAEYPARWNKMQKDLFIPKAWRHCVQRKQADPIPYTLQHVKRIRRNSFVDPTNILLQIFGGRFDNLLHKIMFRYNVMAERQPRISEKRILFHSLRYRVPSTVAASRLVSFVIIYGRILTLIYAFFLDHREPAPILISPENNDVRFL